MNAVARRIAEFAPYAEMMPGAVVVHDLRDQTIAWMSQRALKGINATAEEVIGKPLGDFHARCFNPADQKEYVPKIVGLRERNNNDEIVTYFEQVRLAGQNDWTWHMSSVRIFMRDENEAPILVISISLPIDSMHHMTVKAARLLEENNFLRRNFEKFASLTKREREILRLLVMGKSASETAEQLYISLNTVETHRKRLRNKLDTSSYFELSQYARAFDLI